MALQAGRLHAPAPCRSCVRPCRTTTRSRSATVSVRASGPPRWAGQYNVLKANNLRTLAPQDAAEMAAKGEAIIVDVRPKAAFEQAHIEGSVSVPLFQALDLGSGQILQKAFKWVAYAANGVTPIEPNPNFSEEMKQASKNGTIGVILACEAGGTMKPSVNFPEGKASRSLQAAYRVITERITPNVMHMERGMYGWYQSDLPFVGEYKPDVGRTPSAASEPTIKILSSARGYEMRPDDK